MKIIQNLGAGVKLFGSIGILDRYKFAIKKAKDAGDLDKERALILHATQTWTNKCVKLFKLDINIMGEENLPPKGPVLFVSNHQSYVDILVFLNAIKDRQIGFIAKEDLMKLPIYSRWILITRGLYLKRDDPREALKTINEGCSLLKQGYSLVIFPEGTRSKGPTMGEFKPGSFKLATKAGVPIVPVTLSGGYKIYENDGIVKPGKIDFYIHKPIETSNLDRHQQAGLVEEVEQIIRDKLVELSAPEE